MQRESISIPMNGLTVKDSADLQEQVLIHLFVVEQLLNSQPGGYNAKYLPDREDFGECLANVNLHFFQKLKIYYHLTLLAHPRVGIFIPMRIDNWVNNLV